MKKHFWIFFCFACYTTMSCNEQRENTTTKQAKHANLEPYIFKKSNPEEVANHKAYCQKFYQDFWEQNEVSGGLLVAQHGNILFEKYRGYSNFEKKTPITNHTPLHIASTSKVMTGLAILKLIEAKQLTLTDTLEKFFPNFPYKNITILDLLTHRSGLPNYLHFTAEKGMWDIKKILTNQDVLQLLIDKKPEITNPPNTHFSYNNTNFVLLALIIENVTGMSYAKAMHQIIFDPIEMKDTYVFEYNKDIHTAAKSYYNNGKEWQMQYLDGTYGDKNIYSTPRDLYKLDQAMYAPNFLPKELMTLALKGYSYEKKGVKNYGLAIRMMEFDNGTKFWFHNGWWHGSNSVFVRDIADEATIIAIGNKYSRSVYSSFNLVALFGNYPLELPDASDTNNLE